MWSTAASTPRSRSVADSNDGGQPSSSLRSRVEVCSSCGGPSACQGVSAAMRIALKRVTVCSYCGVSKITSTSRATRLSRLARTAQPTTGHRCQGPLTDGVNHADRLCNHVDAASVKLRGRVSRTSPIPRNGREPNPCSTGRGVLGSGASTRSPAAVQTKEAHGGDALAGLLARCTTRRTSLSEAARCAPDAQHRPLCIAVAQLHCRRSGDPFQACARGDDQHLEGHRTASEVVHHRLQHDRAASGLACNWVAGWQRNSARHRG